MKKLLKIGFFAFLLFVLLIAATVVVLKVMYPPERIRAIVEPELTRILRRDVQVKSASISLYPNIGIQIEELSMTNTSRTVKVDQPGDLWSLLKQSHLHPKHVVVVLNGKEQTDVVSKNISLKSGDVLKISRQGFRNQEKLFSLGKLFVDVEVFSLLQKKVVIQKILIERLQVLVEVDRRGSFNFDDLLGASDTKDKKKPAPKKPAPTKPSKPASSEIPVSLRLNSFEIKDSKIVYYNRKTQQEIILGGIQQKLAVQVDPAMQNVLTKGLLEIKRMTVSGKGIPVRKSGMYFLLRHNLHVDLKAGSLKISDLTVGLQRILLTTKGVVNGFDKPVRHVDLSIQSNKWTLQDLYREVPPAMFPQARKMSVKGSAQLGVSIKGKLDAKRPNQLPSISGTFKINEAYIKYADLPKAISNLNADIAFTTNSLDVKKLTLNVGENPISVLLKVADFKKPTVDAKINANLDLATLKDAMKLPPGVTVRGRVKADITAKGKIEPKNPEAIAVQGQIDFANIVATTPAVKKPVQVNGTFKFSNQEITLDELTTTIGQSSFTMDMKIRDYLSLALPKKVKAATTRITYSMNSPLLDIDEMLGSQKGGSKPSSGASAKSSDKAGGSSSSGDEPIQVPKLPDVTFDGKIRVDKLMYAGMPITKGAIDLSYQKGVINFNLQAGLYSGKIQEKFVVDISNSRQLRVHNRFSCLNMEANDFISNLNDVPKNDGKLMSSLKSMDNTIYGKLNLQSDIKTHGNTSNQFKNNTSGTIVAQLRSGQIKNATILGELTSPLPKIIKPFIPNLTDFRLSKLMLLNMEIKQGKIHVTNLAIPLRQLDLKGYGTIGLDNTMDMKMDITLSAFVSRKITQQQKRLRQAAGGLLGKIGGGQVGKMAQGALGSALDRVQLIPTNKQGRVVPIIGAKGKTNRLQYYLAGFQGETTQDTGGAGGGPSLVDQAKAGAKKALEDAKKKALAAAEDAKKKALAIAEDAKKKALAAAEDAKKKGLAAAEDAKKNAQAAAKKLQRDLEQQKKDAQKKAKDAVEQAKKNLGGGFRPF